MEVVIRKAGVAALESGYNVRLPRPAAEEQQDRYALGRQSPGFRLVISGSCVSALEVLDRCSSIQH